MRARGATTPATSMSSMTSPSASTPGAFWPPRTGTATTWGEDDAALAGVGLDDVQALAAGELLDALHIGRGRPVGVGERLAGDGRTAAGQRHGRLDRAGNSLPGPRTEFHGHPHVLVGIDRS